MKFTLLISAAALSGVAFLAMPVRVAAQKPVTGYAITDLGTLQNGTFSYAAFISNSGLIGGRAAPADGTWHTTFWRKSLMTDVSQFATPGMWGLNSEAFGINDRGQLSGEAETTTRDPNGEDFCGFKALGLPNLGATCLPVVYQNGGITPLPTLGGPNGQGSQINSQGQVIGLAENTTRDPACPGPQIFQIKPVLWDHGKAQELPTAPGDPHGIGLGISDNGIATGASGTCAAFNLETQFAVVPVHPLAWQNGKVTVLPTLGGSGQFGGNLASAANGQGQVVGNSDLTGDTAFHGTLWQNGGVTDLLPFGKDFASSAFSINDRGDITGFSADDSFNLRAVIWENGATAPADLNSRIVSNPTGLYLEIAEGINARGEIIGFAQTPSGDTHGYLATPVNGASANARVSADAVRPLVLSPTARKLLQRKMRFGRVSARLRQKQ